MKIVGYVIFCALVLVASIWIRRPTGVQDEKTNPEITEAQELWLSSTEQRKNDHDQGKSGAGRNEAKGRLSSLPEPKRGFFEMTQKESQRNKKEALATFEPPPAADNDDENLAWGNSPFGEVTSDDSSFKGFGDPDFGGENPFLEGNDNRAIPFEGLGEERLGNTEGW